MTFPFKTFDKRFFLPLPIPLTCWDAMTTPPPRFCRMTPCHRSYIPMKDTFCLGDWYFLCDSRSLSKQYFFSPRGWFTLRATLVHKGSLTPFGMLRPRREPEVIAYLREMTTSTGPDPPPPSEPFPNIIPDRSLRAPQNSPFLDFQFLTLSPPPSRSLPFCPVQFPCAIVPFPLSGTRPQPPLVPFVEATPIPRFALLFTLKFRVRATHFFFRL